ncbi:MAG: TatD DNase family protein [Parcubacteria group bacterium Gr01-1014_66]|nr:MAG: TatD DNase family protein [Parcubacteria group bacterium Gr01-1014_66]
MVENTHKEKITPSFLKMPTPYLFDVHTHTQFAAFVEDKDAVIRRALDGGVWIINVGTQQDTSRAAIEIAHQYPEGVYATVGLHPIHTAKSFHDVEELGATAEAKGFTSRGEKFDYNYYKKLAEDQKVVAIGECGLDYHRFEEDTKQIQHKAFEEQIALAHEVKKPLMIHCRKAFGDLISLLKAESRELIAGNAGIIHFFSGTIEDASSLLDLGFSFSFGGVITFARDYDDVIRYIPIERIMLETDAPYITPVPYRGKRNESLFITETAKKKAKLKGLTYDEIARETTANARELFGIQCRICVSQRGASTGQLSHP